MQNQFVFGIIVVVLIVILILNSKKRSKKKKADETVVGESVTIDMIPESKDDDEKYNFSELLDDIQKEQDLEASIKEEKYITSISKELEELKISISESENDISQQLKSATKIAIKLQDIVMREKFNGNVEVFSNDLLEVKELMIEKLEEYTNKMNELINSMDIEEANVRKKEIKQSLVEMKLELEVYRKIETKILEKLKNKEI